MTTLWMFRESRTLMHANRDVRPRGLLQEIQFTDHAAKVKVRGHFGTLRVLVKELSGDSRCFLRVGSTLQV